MINFYNFKISDELKEQIRNVHPSLVKMGWPDNPSEDSVAELICDHDYNAGIEAYKQLGRECAFMTQKFYPKKLTLEEFSKEITNSLPIFVKNMKNLNKNLMWTEDWIQLFASWMEMEKGDFTN